MHNTTYTEEAFKRTTAGKHAKMRAGSFLPALLVLALALSQVSHVVYKACGRLWLTGGCLRVYCSRVYCCIDCINASGLRSKKQRMSLICIHQLHFRQPGGCRCSDWAKQQKQSLDSCQASLRRCKCAAVCEIGALILPKNYLMCPVVLGLPLTPCAGCTLC